MAYRGGFRGPGGFTRPENALKRAEELENVGQRNAALQVLHDVITSKKHRTWSKTYESIMFKHIDLVVEMKKRSYGKEALMQYRNMCQAVNINSLEEVIKYFLKKANDKAEEAQKSAAAMVTIDVADLEEDASPEDIMLSYVSGDKSKDRTDRELVTPWFRFLWETYRSVLDILRTNPKLEPVYAMTASKAFQFCLQFKRTVEFRRLCDILRQHLTNLTLRYRDNREAQPDQLQLHLETRFEQLKVACELEMWAEAFRSVEDIQALVALAKKAPKQQLMATYYARLTQIFAVSENHLYHAYAWLKLFNFSRSYNKNMTAADLQAMASSMVLSMLSILPYDHKHQGLEDSAAEQEKERIMRMANILGFAVDSRKDYRSVLSRAALLNSVVGAHNNIISLVPQEIRAIFELLTNEFSPLELCARMEPLLARLGDAATGTITMSAASPIKNINLAMYVKQLKQVAVLRLLKQLSEVYSTLRIATLEQLVPFMPFSEVEAVVVDAVKCDYLQVRIDHRNGTLHFGSQQLDSDGMRNHLQLLAARLSKAVGMVAPEPRAAAAAAREAAIKAAADKLAELNVKAIARKALIERRKEEAELALLEAEKEEERRRVAAAREAEAAEERRRKEEAIRREKERLEKELEEQELAEARAMLEAAQKKKAGGAGGKPGAKADDKPLDKRQIMQEALNERFKEAQEMERRMAKLARQQDHLERARREEEVPLLQELADRRESEDRQLFTQVAEAEATKHRAQWEADLAEKHRLSGMVEDKEQFAAMIIARRQEEFEALRRQRARHLAERREQLRQERAVARRREYIRRCQAEIEERVAAIEAERAEAEAERKRAEEAERQRKLDEALAQQRKREAEVEAKLREEKQAAVAGAAAAAAPSAASSTTAPAAGGGKFVPSVARKAVGADAPPAAAADRWGGRRDEPPPARGDDDRWGGGRRDAAPPAAGRYAPPVRSTAADGAPAAERPAAAPAPAAAAAPSPAAAPAPKPAGGKFVPPHLRNRS